MAIGVLDPAPFQAPPAPASVAGGFDPSGLDVLDFAARERGRGARCVLATVVRIHGSSPRALGAQMAVARDGRSIGHVSSGCLERAIVAEAQAVMESGAGRLVRYGQGSQYIDIALPCGSALEVLFTLDPSPAALTRAMEAARGRAAFALSFDLASGAAAFQSDSVAFAGAGRFLRAYAPRLRIVAAGQGAELTTLARIALAGGYDVCAVSPDQAALESCALAGAEIVRLASSRAAPDVRIDSWTAMVLLFHEREWEIPLLTRALSSPAFYVGAVGSRRTASARLQDLAQAGVPAERVARLRGPIGMLAATRDPSALALSALTEIVASWRDS